MSWGKRRVGGEWEGRDGDYKDVQGWGNLAHGVTLGVGMNGRKKRVRGEWEGRACSYKDVKGGMI